VPKHGNTGVRRNRLKRRLRELLRREILPELPAGENAVDVVVRTRREAYGAAFPQLREELSRWLERSTGRSAGR
jgi:ribonuclease P protein component